MRVVFNTCTTYLYIMVSQRLIKYLRKIAEDSFKEGQEVDTRDINAALKNMLGKYRWSSNEIAGALPRVSDTYIPTGEKNIYGLYTYIVEK